ncbi:hypothetical protein JCM19000A_25360 [Silvimonas sp. JCM 19000]
MPLKFSAAHKAAYDAHFAALDAYRKALLDPGVDPEHCLELLEAQQTTFAVWMELCEHDYGLADPPER